MSCTHQKSSSDTVTLHRLFMIFWYILMTWYLCCVNFSKSARPPCTWLKMSREDAMRCYQWHEVGGSTFFAVRVWVWKQLAGHGCAACSFDGHVCISVSVNFSSSGEIVYMRSSDCNVWVKNIKSSTAVLCHVCVLLLNSMFELSFLAFMSLCFG